MLNATIVLKNHFINYKNSHKYNFIAKVIKHLMKFSNLNSTSFSLFLRKEWIYFSYIYKKTKDTKKCVQTSSTFEKKNQRKEILWEIITEEEREGSKEIEGVQKQIIIEERGGWLKRRDTRREEEGNETSAYDEKRRRSAWSRKRERRG